MARILVPLALSMLMVGCAGGSHGSNLAAYASGFSVTPGNPALAVGQSVQFQAHFPWSGPVGWYVNPATAGVITTAGRFTADTAPGTCTVTAVWLDDLQIQAQTTVTLLAPPPPAESSSNAVLASGLEQASANASIANAIVIGETMPATLTTSADGTIQIRTDFLPTGILSAD